MVIHLNLNAQKKYLYTPSVKRSSVDKQILFLTSLETNQNRYRNQVKVPFVSAKQKEAIHNRLATVFSRKERIQKECSIAFSDKRSGHTVFRAEGCTDVIKNKTVYELKFVSELSHEHFLQCACYMIALKLKKGILWNVRDNTMYEITIPDKKAFMNATASTITKHAIPAYFKPKAKR